MEKEDCAMQFLSQLEGVRQTGKNQWMARCPAHDDEKPSLSIKLDSDRILVHCHAGCDTKEILRALRLTEADLFLDRNGKRIAATYDYQDPKGKLLFQVVRFEPKGFAQRRPNGNGGWLWDLKGVNRVLYRLPELLAADPDEPVFVVEGEKDADRLAALGLVATTNPGGAGKWRKDYATVLASRHVVILPDNDRPGREHARKVAESLKRVAASVKIVDLPGLPPKGDVSDWLAQGHTAEELKELVEGVPEYTPGSEVLGRIVRFSEVEPEEVKWLWWPRIPRNKLTLISGDPGSGKTFLAIDIAARVTRGDGFPNSTDTLDAGSEKPGKVLYLSYEDGLADTLVPRAQAAGANLDYLMRPEIAPTFEQCEALEALIRSVKPALVVIDPVQGFVGSGINWNAVNEVRSVLGQLARMAEAAKTTILLVGHLGKGARSSPLYRVLGSIDFTAAPRSVLLVARENRDNPNSTRVLATLKMNLAPEGEPLAFHIVGEDSSAHIEWQGSVNTTAAELLEPQEDSTAREEAVGFLMSFLAEGPRPAREIYTEAEAAGISKRTLKRAKKILGVSSRKEGMDGPWVWELPKEATVTETGTLGTLRTSSLPIYISSSSHVGPLRGEVGTLREGVGPLRRVPNIPKSAKPHEEGHLGTLREDPSRWPTCRGCGRKVPEVSNQGFCPDCVAVGGESNAQ